MGSWVTCECGNLIHTNMFAGAGISVLVPEEFLDREFKGMSAEELVAGIVIKNDHVFVCGKCGRLLIERKAKNREFDVYVPENNT